MARFKIRNVGDETKELLRKQAGNNGRSVSEEVKAIFSLQESRGGGNRRAGSVT